MHMNFKSVGNTLFLKDLLETSLFDELQEDDTFEHIINLLDRKQSLDTDSYNDQLYNQPYNQSNDKFNDQQCNQSNDKKNVGAYTPKFVRGRGPEREGYCEACSKWFKLKTSSYWYHMNYKHGINSKGERYPSPKTRNVNRMVEGYCEKCQQWINLGKGRKDVRFSWLRHMQKQHNQFK